MGPLPITDFAEVNKKYEEERAKRIRPDGMAQYVDIGKDPRYKHFTADPLATPDNKYAQLPAPIGNGGHSKVLVVGSGFGALLYTVRLMEKAGFKSEDFVLVDSSWGFGGTWYWNRYPGLMCDVESACYFPLLEETGYIPKHRYAYGPELRAYSEFVAEKYGLDKRALFGSTVIGTAWNEDKKCWESVVVRKNIDGTEETLNITSSFFGLASGILSRPKLAQLPGIETFAGHMFHTSRWDYAYTGGSPEEPDMENLKDKKVAFIGTGATAIQAIPQLAKCAKHLCVFQRTPSTVDERGQRPLDLEQFRKEIANGKGWQRARRENMAAFMSNIPELPDNDLVDDGWTNFTAFSAMLGSPRIKDVTRESIGEYLGYLHQKDLERSNRIRQRVRDVVKSEETAEALQHWYPGWCKRPCFHDDYLDAFNGSNVQLVHTDGRGIDGYNEQGVVFDGKTYDADVIIFGTGYYPPTYGSPATRAGLTIKGRDGLNMDDKWTAGVKTFHGVMTRGFPNLLMVGLIQAGATVSAVHFTDLTASHAAYIIGALRKAYSAEGGKEIVVEPTDEAETAWAMQCAQTALGFAAAQGCTPSYTTREGEQPKIEKPEDGLRVAMAVPWGYGILDFTKKIEEWEASGDLSAFEVHSA